MQPDSNRQWFVYFNEKEMGPFFEREVLQKLKISEFDPTAYVFTEGMTDWALVQDTPVLLRAEAAAKGQSQIRAMPPPEPEPVLDANPELALDAAFETAEEPMAEQLPVEDPFAEEAKTGFEDEHADAPQARGQTASRAQAPGADATRLADFSHNEGSKTGASGTQSGFRSVTNSGQSAGSSVSKATAPAVVAPKSEKKGFSLFSKKKKEDTQSEVAAAPAVVAAAAVAAATVAAAPKASRGKTNTGVPTGKTNAGQIAQTSAPAPESTDENAPTDATAAKPGKTVVAAKPRKKTSPVLLGAFVFVLVFAGLYGAATMGIQIPYLSSLINGSSKPVAEEAAPSEEPPAEMVDGADGAATGDAATPAATDAANSTGAGNVPATSQAANNGAVAPGANGAASLGANGAAAQSGAANAGATPQAGANKRAATSAVSGVEQLQSFRTNRDPSGKPFKLASVIGDKFPLIVGALSPLLDVQQVAVAVFPDNEHNLMMIPQIWLLKAPVINGYFSVGPLNLDGNALPPGRYMVYAQLGEKSLGGEAVDVGVWPAQAEVDRIRGEFKKEREKVAGAEREAFDMKLREVANAFNQLKTKSTAANRGLKGRRDWDSFKRPWIVNLTKAIKDQDAVNSGPMFYGEAQALLARYLGELKKLYESYEMLSTGGPKFLVRQRGPDALGKQMAEILRIQNDIGQASKGLADKPLQAFQLDPKKVQDNLAAFAVSDRIKK